MRRRSGCTKPRLLSAEGGALAWACRRADFAVLSVGGPREGTRVGVLSAVRRDNGKCIRGLARAQQGFQARDVATCRGACGFCDSRVVRPSALPLKKDDCEG